MIKIKQKRVEETTVKHDSIEYKVYVYEKKGGYWGEWYCTTCRKWGSGGSKKCKSIEEKQFYNPDSPICYVFKESGFKEIYFASDGISSFLKNGVKLPIGDVIKKFLDIGREDRNRAVKGAVIQRRCRKAIKVLRKEGWGHYDDISFGGFLLWRDTT